tara:strand:+ start:6258 stop:6539 length:282 start_codon:yes stop_codon:yes gene_type:complete
MAQNTDITLAADTWALLTNSNVTSITFQNKGAYHILVKGTTGTAAPTDENGSIRYNPGQGERNVLLSDLFSGTSSVRVWAKSKKSLPVMVSHA